MKNPAYVVLYCDNVHCSRPRAVEGLMVEMETHVDKLLVRSVLYQNHLHIDFHTIS